jgi:hypothetical protein
LAGQSAVIVDGFNRQFYSLTTNLAARQATLNAKLATQLANESSFKRLRGGGVTLAWRYEKADIEMGGSGTENWTASEKERILHSPKHKVPGAEGHHINNVAKHPEMQADADNIKFYRSRKEHLNEGHGGDFNNESRGDLIDREAKLIATNRARILRQELTAMGISAAIGFSIGFGITLAFELSRNGFKNGDFVKSLGAAAGSGIKSAGLASVGYLSTRLITTRFGVSSYTAGFIAGAAMIFAAGAVKYARRRMDGWNKESALIQSVKESSLPLATMSASFAFALLGGPVVGTAVVLGMTALTTAFAIGKNIKGRKLNEVIDAVVVECHEPHYA